MLEATHQTPKNDTQFAAYTGPSMNPTLREPEVMEVTPYGERPVRVGDVIFFKSPDEGRPVVHRVIRVTPAGIRTRGDNNAFEDDYLLHRPDIAGQVVAAWRGQQRREIAGGGRGWLVGRWGRCRQAMWRVLYRPLFRLIQPVYQPLVRRNIVACMLPKRLKPRVATFQTAGRSQFRLMLGRRVIGHYDARRDQWIIKTPFRLLVDEQTLTSIQGNTST